MALAEALTLWDIPATSIEGARRYQQVATAQDIARAYIFPQDIRGGGKNKVDSKELAAAFRVLRAAGRLHKLHVDFIDTVEASFRYVKDDMARYWVAIEQTIAAEAQEQTQSVMTELFSRIATWQRRWARPLHMFEDDSILRQFNSQFHRLLYAAFPASFQDCLFHYLSYSLEAAGAHEEEGNVKHAYPSQHLLGLNLVHRYATTLMRVAFDEIDKIAAEEAAEGLAERRLARARQRVSSSLSNWMSTIFQGNEALLRSIYSRFDYHLCKSFFDIRTDELFDIIVDFPDSMAALEDLKDCLFKIDQRDQVVEKFNVKRLLHPGAETKDVISQYINTIRCLRIIDPVGVLLHKVAEPIRRHLRDRPDTIRCIVASLVEGEELQDENDPTSAAPLAAISDNNVEDFTDPKWEPEPNDAAPEFRTGRNSDIVGTLVSIYETQEAIVKELQTYLAGRLLVVEGYDAVKEVRTIELLRVRFGEEALHVCDVMLKDMSDSKRINDHVHGEIDTIVQPLIISRIFWPDIAPSSLHLTPKLEAAEKEYEAAFHHFKPDKHLLWLQEQGTASVTLELEDRTVTVDVTPLQAAVAELFEFQDTWTEEDLAKKLEVNVILVRGALAVWAGHGVFKSEDDGSWRVLEVLEVGVDQQVPVIEAQSAFQSIDGASVHEKGSIFWGHIRGAIAELGPQNLSSLHRVLSHDKNYNMTVDELAMFLTAAKGARRLMEGRDGKWILPK
ncbi:uncharacterized protein CcaverHIS019_0403700 [Cutaneotrichosporon cavernicola]|uniref:Cullin family profile domain-containing protein n=1 Tax=Cutaneotrichosporon cavernicola TaxID=279322 RepID=A0AA48L410_9TREE|nr:uncharacterized protein CcaverHIS019_0403700 [Cutaneotrichosporon cavernicola]BEI91550.1 hypothetical protein CcaverHIS019_0403700 [Cutaneotrichosporon cavernicola]